MEDNQGTSETGQPLLVPEIPPETFSVVSQQLSDVDSVWQDYWLKYGEYLVWQGWVTKYPDQLDLQNSTYVVPPIAEVEIETEEIGVEEDEEGKDNSCQNLKLESVAEDKNNQSDYNSCHNSFGDINSGISQKCCPIDSDIKCESSDQYTLNDDGLTQIKNNNQPLINTDCNDIVDSSSVLTDVLNTDSNPSDNENMCSFVTRETERPLNGFNNTKRQVEDSLNQSSDCTLKPEQIGLQMIDSGSTNQEPSDKSHSISDQNELQNPGSNYTTEHLNKSNQKSVANSNEEGVIQTDGSVRNQSNPPLLWTFRTQGRSFDDAVERTMKSITELSQEEMLEDISEPCEESGSPNAHNRANEKAELVQMMHSYSCRQESISEATDLYETPNESIRKDDKEVVVEDEEEEMQSYDEIWNDLWNEHYQECYWFYYNQFHAAYERHVPSSQVPRENNEAYEQEMDCLINKEPLHNCQQQSFGDHCYNVCEPQENIEADVEQDPQGTNTKKPESSQIEGITKEMTTISVSEVEIETVRGSNSSEYQPQDGGGHKRKSSSKQATPSQNSSSSSSGKRQT